MTRHVWTLAPPRRKLWDMIRLARTALLALTLALVTAGFACGGGDDDSGATKTPTSNESYAEGNVRMEVEYLDTGLLKGHSYADAASGYKVTAMKVEAVDHKGASWNVIDAEQAGVDSANASEFFEVVIQEIPRGKQLTLTAAVTFEDADGNKVERTAVDNWPP